VYYRQGDLDQAIADYSRVIELSPELALAYYNRGYAYREKGLKAQAVADFEMYLQLEPNGAYSTEVEGWLRELKGQ